MEPLVSDAMAMAVLMAFRNEYRPASESDLPDPVAAMKRALQMVLGGGEVSYVSPREYQVLGMLLNGLNYKRIALDLGLSVSTVRTHVHHVYATLETNNRCEIFLRYLRGEIKLIGDKPFEVMPLPEAA
jgi:DNA-binding NarL/FixJ family response regulator